MMPTMRRRWVTVGALLAGLFGGAAAAQVVENTRRVRSLDTGLFALKADDRASFFVTLNDKTVDVPAHVRLQFFDHAGVSTATQEVELQPGQSARLHTAGPGYFRARAEVLDTALQLTSGPTVLGTVEVLNLTTAQRGPVCTVWDNGVDGQRQ
jgi:hypothetical protein